MKLKDELMFVPKEPHPNELRSFSSLCSRTPKQRELEWAALTLKIFSLKSSTFPLLLGEIEGA